MRPVLFVIGPHSGCGKTLFVTQLLRHVRGLGCLKISPAYAQAPPAAVARGETNANYWLEPAARLQQQGKDTALYWAAGAVQVERLRHRCGELAAGLQAALRRFAPRVPVIVESSSAIELLTPVAVVLVVRPPLREMKPSTAGVLGHVSDLLINATDRDGRAASFSADLRNQFPELAPSFTWCADLGSKPLPKPLLARLQGLLA